MRQLVLFQTGNTAFALDRNCIRRIRPMLELRSASKVRVQQQMIEDKDGSLLLIDLAATSDHSPIGHYPSTAELIVVEASPPYALVADQVNYAMDVNGGQVDELPSVFGETARAYFPGVVYSDEQMALVIDTGALARLNTLPEKLYESSRARTSKGVDLKQETPPSETPEPSHSSSVPGAGNALEKVVGTKLRAIIQRRVREVTAETVARVLKRQAM